MAWDTEWAAEKASAAMRYLADSTRRPQAPRPSTATRMPHTPPRCPGMKPAIP